VDAGDLVDGFRILVEEVGQVRPRTERDQRERLLGGGEWVGQDLDRIGRRDVTDNFGSGNAEEAVDACPPLRRKEAAVWAGLLATAADRSGLGAELGEQPRQVAHPGLAMRLAVALDRDRLNVHSRLAQQRHDREHVVGREVGVDDDRQGTAGRRGGLPDPSHLRRRRGSRPARGEQEHAGERQHAVAREPALARRVHRHQKE
jgi:hypothetical protein